MKTSFNHLNERRSISFAVFAAATAARLSAAAAAADSDGKGDTSSE